MAAVSQTTLSDAFSWMKMLEFRLRFQWSLFLRIQLTTFQHWFRWWLGAGQATSHYLNQWWFDYRRIYASPGLNELITFVVYIPQSWKSGGRGGDPEGIHVDRGRGNGRHGLPRPRGLLPVPGQSGRQVCLLAHRDTRKDEGPKYVNTGVDSLLLQRASKLQNISIINIESIMDAQLAMITLII